MLMVEDLRSVGHESPVLRSQRERTAPRGRSPAAAANADPPASPGCHAQHDTMGCSRNSAAGTVSTSLDPYDSSCNANTANNSAKHRLGLPSIPSGNCLDVTRNTLSFNLSSPSEAAYLQPQHPSPAVNAGESNKAVASLNPSSPTTEEEVTPRKPVDGVHHHHHPRLSAIPLHPSPHPHVEPRAPARTPKAAADSLAVSSVSGLSPVDLVESPRCDPPAPGARPRPSWPVDAAAKPAAPARVGSTSTDFRLSDASSAQVAAAAAAPPAVGGKRGAGREREKKAAGGGRRDPKDRPHSGSTRSSSVQTESSSSPAEDESSARSSAAARSQALDAVAAAAAAAAVPAVPLFLDKKQLARNNDRSILLAPQSCTSFLSPCLQWIRDQADHQRELACDGLLCAQEFLDARQDVGGWIRIGFTDDLQVRYSCNGHLRPAFKEVDVKLRGTNAYICFTDIQRGVVLPLSQYAIEALLPGIRATFQEAGTRHNIPSNRELQTYYDETIMCTSGSLSSLHYEYALLGLKEENNFSCTLLPDAFSNPKQSRMDEPSCSSGRCAGCSVM
ncbi:hypothetical protein DIPPA_34077 [Diplonema papillatum]|nr:hypothetical protein DIPPA_34077 [Diplonema papillatum]